MLPLQAPFGPCIVLRLPLVRLRVVRLLLEVWLVPVDRLVPRGGDARW